MSSIPIWRNVMGWVWAVLRGYSQKLVTILWREVIKWRFELRSRKFYDDLPSRISSVLILGGQCADRYEPEFLVEVAPATFARASASVLEEQLRMTFQNFGIHIQPNLSKQFGLRGEFLCDASLSLLWCTYSALYEASCQFVCAKLCWSDQYVNDRKWDSCPRSRPRLQFIRHEFGIDRRTVVICTVIEGDHGVDNGVDPTVHTE